MIQSNIDPQIFFIQYQFKRVVQDNIDPLPIWFNTISAQKSCSGLSSLIWFNKNSAQKSSSRHYWPTKSDSMQCSLKRIVQDINVPHNLIQRKCITRKSGSSQYWPPKTDLKQYQPKKVVQDNFHPQNLIQRNIGLKVLFETMLTPQNLFKHNISSKDWFKTILTSKTWFSTKSAQKTGLR